MEKVLFFSTNQKQGLSMIDTISIGTQEFAFQKHTKLVLRTDLNLETGEILEKYFKNLDTFNLTVDSKGLRLHFSLPKLYGLKDNFYPLGAHSFRIAIDNLQRTLQDIGIITDVNQMKILRLDIFKNIETQKNYKTYVEILRNLGLKRTHKREYPDGFLCSNSLREVMFYNKIKELKDSFGVAYVRKFGFDTENVVRGEVRLLKHREVTKQGITYLKEIPDKWGLLKEIYRSYMMEVFKYEFQEGGESLKIEDLKALTDFALYALRQEGRNALKVFGFYPFFFVYRGELLDALQEQYSRRQAYQILSEIERNKKKYLGLYKTLDYKKLYTELQVKFLN